MAPVSQELEPPANSARFSLYEIDDVVGRDSDRWVVDFGTSMDEASAALFEAPFEVIEKRVVPFRADPEKCRSDEIRLKSRFWEFQRPRPELRKAIGSKSRFILTPESSEHRVFVYAPTTVIPVGSLFAIARDDDTTLGILMSRIHEVWSTAQGNRLGVGNQRRYNISVTFETFPFPEGLTPDLLSTGLDNDVRAMEIADATAKLVAQRDAWLNPAELVRHEAEIVDGYPDRPVPVDKEAAASLRRRTLTDLYNLRPTWLVKAHAKLDAAVEQAYGWPSGLSDDQILGRLLELNLQRSGDTSA